MMKKTLRILTIVFAVAVAIASCSKEPQLVGKWKLTKLNIENQQIAAMLMGYTQQAIGQEFEFKADGTVTSDAANDTLAQSDATLHYTLDGNNITFTADLGSLASDTTLTPEQMAIIQQYDNRPVTGTYELPDDTKLKMSLGIPLPENQMGLTELKLSIEAERQ